MYAEDSGSMDDCNAALILLKLSASPHSPQRKNLETLMVFSDPHY